MPQITLSPDFFKKEAQQAYSSMPTAFARENLQNSVDAGSSIIKISITEPNVIPDVPYGTIEFSIEDNGCGMTRDILENVFFNLGASTKDDASTISGFGRARILTHFSQTAYLIATGDLICKGRGASFDILPSMSNRKGCKMVIAVDPTRRNGGVYDYKQALENYLSLCQLPCRVLINNVPWTSWTYRRSVTRTLNLNGQTFATVHVNKSAENKGLIIVRVSGTMMYTISTRAKAQIIVEIVPELSRTVLTSNRDGMHWDYQNVLNDFMDELSTESRTSLLRKINLITEVKDMGGHFWHYRKSATANLSTKPNPECCSPFSVLPDRVTINDPVSVAGKNAQENTVPEIFEDIDDIRKPLPFDILINNSVDTLENDQHKQNVSKVINSYNPNSWGFANGNNPPIGGKKIKLLLLWQKICQHTIAQYLELVKRDSLEWGIGWTFGVSEAELCTRNSVSFALLNPVNTYGKMKYSLRGPKDLNKLIALAIHEISHISASCHDEDFANIQTDLTWSMLAVLPEIKRDIKAILKRDLSTRLST